MLLHPPAPTPRQTAAIIVKQPYTIMAECRALPKRAGQRWTYMVCLVEGQLPGKTVECREGVLGWRYLHGRWVLGMSPPTIIAVSCPKSRTGPAA